MLQLCLPRKQMPPPVASQQFAQAVVHPPAYRRLKHKPLTQTVTQRRNKALEPRGAWGKKPFTPSVTQVSHPSPPTTQGVKKETRYLAYYPQMGEKGPARHLIRFVRPSDWSTSIDLKDEYFYILIYPPHRKFQIAFQGMAYEYCWASL